MKRARFFDRHGTEIDEHDAYDRSGVLKDGCRMSVPMWLADAARSEHDTERRPAKPVITEGTTDDPLILNRPGWRIPTVQDRRSVVDAYEKYQDDLCTAYLNGNKRGDEDDDEDDDRDTRGSRKIFGPGNHGTASRTVTDMTRDHQQNMSKLYSALDAELQNAWRR